MAIPVAAARHGRPGGEAGVQLGEVLALGLGRVDEREGGLDQRRRLG